MDLQPPTSIPGKPLASISLDLDNLWSYMKTHGDPGWESFPSYLDTFIPLVLDLLDELDLGEAETIVLARKLSANLVLMDERKGRRKLTQLSMPKIGTLGILLI